MGRSRNFLIAAAILLFAAGVVLLNAGNRQEEPDRQAVSERFPGRPMIADVEQGKKPIRINSLESGTGLKDYLRSQSGITLIKHNNRDESHYHEREATVKYKVKPDAEESARIAREIDGELIKSFDHTKVYRSRSKDTDFLLQYFNHNPKVLYAEPNYIYMQNDEKKGPNDSLYRKNYQWNLHSVRAEEGWDITKGDKGIKIAVIDTGVDLDHPDLKQRLVRGYNVLAKNNNADDDNGHGTHVAGIIASKTNNLKGVAGLTWFNKIMPVKVMNDKGYGNAFDVARGVIWAADHGADVINLSLGNYQPSAVMKEAVQYAFNKNIVITTAAGNDNTDQPSFPAAYPEVICVAAVDYNGKRADFSNFGEYVDVSAPGVEIPSTYFHKQYASLSGTSMAAPHVAALAGLIRSANPRLKNTEVMTLISKNSFDLGKKGFDPYYGSGVIDIRRSLQQVKDPGGDRNNNLWDEFRQALNFK
ncbi:S8 family peptidase [Peribacillus sp. SCS-26]|uniref:S8 family peptidase n=1 Tax=Paraperibacillus marinus TaxID=3115295 RepID=UPI003906558F